MPIKNQFTYEKIIGKPFLEFHLNRNFNVPLVFKISDSNENSNREPRKIIIQPEVVKAIIGRVIIDYKPDLDRVNLSQIYDILGYIQFRTEKKILKFGILNQYCIVDSNRNMIIMLLFSEEIIENYFQFPKKDYAILNVKTKIENGIEKLYTYREYPNHNIYIDFNYFKKFYNNEVHNLEEGFSLSQKVCGMIPNP